MFVRLFAGALDRGIVLGRHGHIERHDEVLVALGTLPGIGEPHRYPTINAVQNNVMLRKRIYASFCVTRP